MQKFFCCLLIVIASNVYSQAKSQKVRAHSLETIQVKAVRSSANIYQTGSSIDVITSAEIFNKGYSFVSEALESLGGIDKVHGRYVHIFLEDQILDSRKAVDHYKELIAGLKSF